MFDLVIIGSGPAGMTAAIYAKRANLSVLLLDKLAFGGQMVNTNEIQNYPGAGTIQGAELAIKMYEHTQELGIEFEYATVERISKNNDVFQLDIREHPDTPIVARSVIVASGSTPRRLGVPGEDRFSGNGLSWCAVCDGATCRGKDVVVIGGGNSAVEEAIFLADIARSVAVLVRNELRADPASCDRLRALSNVTIWKGYAVTAFEGNTTLDIVEIHSTANKENVSLECQHAFEYIGFEPLTTFLGEFKILDKDGYILANEDMSTDVPGLFVAGDCRKKGLRQVVTACSDGAIAARSVSKYIKNI